MELSGSQEIKCTVSECRHNDHINNCTLNDILVGASENNVSNKHQTDCLSFEVE